MTLWTVTNDSATFGRVLTAAPPRIGQLAVKLRLRNLPYIRSLPERGLELAHSYHRVLTYFVRLGMRRRYANVMGQMKRSAGWSGYV